MNQLQKVTMLAGISIQTLITPVVAQHQVDLATKPANTEIVGLRFFNQTGHALAVGDVNGDTRPDLVIGAPGLDTQSRPLEGRVYIILGKSSFSGLLDLNRVAADVEIEGKLQQAGLGTTVAVADLNGDGFGDIIMGQPGAATKSGASTGMISVILGRASFSRVMTILEAEMQISGEAALNSLGEAMATGDINHDGIADLIAGVRLADPPNRPGGGKVYVIYGQKKLPNSLDLSQTPADMVVLGPATTQFIGNAVATADLNHDGRDDLIIGNFKANTLNGVDAGKVFVIFGKDSLNKVIDLATQPADVAIFGGKQQDHLGIAVATGDFNGDGKTDLIAGARNADDVAATNSGKVFVFLNPSSWPKEVDLAANAADLTIIGGSDGANLGFSLAVGNLNGDGRDDIIIGAPFASAMNRNQSGAAVVILGRATITQKTIKADAVDLMVLGAAANHTLGSTVAAGDMNHDGRDDMIIAAETATPAGRVYVLSAELVTGVANESATPTIPTAFQLQQNYPNPFNAGTVIPIEVPINAGTFDVAIYNLQGQKLRSLFNGAAVPGAMQLRWDGRDEAGRVMVSGIYWYVLRSEGDASIQNKLILLK